MTHTPRLHSSPGSHHCRRVLLLIEEAGMRVDLCHVDVRPPGMGGENESAAFMQLNPNAKVPVLEDGPLVLLESNAIMFYLCERFAHTALLPTAPESRAAVLAWQFWQAAQLSPTADALMGENMLKPLLGESPDPARVEQLTRDFHRWGAVLDQQLQRGAFLTGDELSCADLSVASALMYDYAAGLPVAEHEALSTWLARMRERPSWIATEPPPMSAR